MSCVKPSLWVKHRLRVQQGLFGLAGAALALWPQIALAESALERVKRTGELVAGTRTDAKPFAYLDGTNQWTGYSIDLLEQIRAEIQQTLGRPVQLKLVPINSAREMMAQIDQGQVDLTCGSSSYSSNREMDVDFSVGYFSTGTKLLIKPNNQLGTEFKIGVIAGTTNEQVIQHHFPIAQFVTFENRAIGLEALRLGRIDGLGSDSILLEALRQSLPEAERQVYEIFPAQEGYSPEIYACMLPQNDAEFKAIVDTALLEFMEAVLDEVPSAMTIFNPWFGETGLLPSEGPGLLAFFQHQVVTHQAITQATSTTTSAPTLSHPTPSR